MGGEGQRRAFKEWGHSDGRFEGDKKDHQHQHPPFSPSPPSEEVDADNWLASTVATTTVSPLSPPPPPPPPPPPRTQTGAYLKDTHALSSCHVPQPARFGGGTGGNVVRVGMKLDHVHVRQMALEGNDVIRRAHVSRIGAAVFRFASSRQGCASARFGHCLAAPTEAPILVPSSTQPSATTLAAVSAGASLHHGSKSCVRVCTPTWSSSVHSVGGVEERVQTSRRQPCRTSFAPELFQLLNFRLQFAAACKRL